MLLILTSRNDLAADFLILKLIEKELPYFRVNCEDLSTASYSFSDDGDGFCREIVLGPRALDLSRVHAVWYRRAQHPASLPGMAPGRSSFMVGELRHLAMGLFLTADAFWVNPFDHVQIGEHKMHQLHLAKALGFRVPRTLVSANAQALAGFVEAQGREAICKPIYHGLYIEDGSRHAIYTRVVTPELFTPETVGNLPVLLQARVPRGTDVRVTIIGERVFVADIAGGADVVDWRDPSIPVSYSEGVIDADTELRCKAMLHRLGLIYGAFDFIRTPQGELVFLEVNPTGEWAWLEDRLGFPMRSAFIDLFFGDGS